MKLNENEVRRKEVMTTREEQKELGRFSLNPAEPQEHQHINGGALPQWGANRPKIMISAGESSGEIHGAALIEAARQKGLDWQVIGLGGDRMAAAGARLLAHVRDLSVMGLTEVVGSLPRILGIRHTLMRSLELDRPAALVLIDSPDFNFALARHARLLGIPVIYYICPQVWAWRESRLKFLAKYTQRRAVIFAFEKKFYEERGVTADWVGHPVLDELPPPSPRGEIRARLGFSPEGKLLALMPGSRRKVVERLAPLLFKAADLLLSEDAGLELALPRADSIEETFLRSLVNAASPQVRERLRILPAGLSRQALSAADATLLASGTSSVEATFLGAPHVAAYRLSSLSWRLQKLLIQVPYASIANLVAGREVVPEFLQDRATPENLAQAVRPLLTGGPARDRIIDDLAMVRAELGQPGASGRVADIIAEEIIRQGRPDQ